MLEPLEAWAVIDVTTTNDFPPRIKERWTFAGEEGKKVGLMAIYDREPEIPDEFKDIKKVVRVFVGSCNDEYYGENELVILDPRSDKKKTFDILKQGSDYKVQHSLV